ncbi:MAG TPA: helix-turn-helix transcriptional regulator [Labilithrix sp.]|nr:helix-turn-helix transcriptional regulator [Labilithrix sp.]
MSPGKAVRRKRRQLGMSVEALAEKSDISPNYLGLLERESHRNPSLDTVRQIAKASACP